MPTAFDIAHRYVDQIAELDPITATAVGLPGFERQMPDLSPDGVAVIAELNRRTVASLEGVDAGDFNARLARDVMLERLGVQLALFDAGEYLRSLRIIASPLQRVREVFDQMPKTTAEHWANITARLSLVPQALEGYRRTLSEGIARGVTASQRQAREAAEQARVWGGEHPEKPSFFAGLREQFERARQPEGEWAAIERDVEAGVEAAIAGYADMRLYLQDEYLPRADEREAAGEERYALMARVFLGASPDLRETYQWGWDELHRIEREMQETAGKIVAGGSVEEAVDLLESDRSRAVEGVEEYRRWLQELHDEALQELHGKHFDIPEEIRRIEVMIPPPGGALAAYYTRPSEDLSRPGRTWWPTGTRTVFPKWGDVTTVYHEGVPGHHLQVATVHLRKEELSRFQRLLTFISGHGEGWALYSERLMAELGFLENPDYYLGMLSAQALRAVRVIIDIGMHLELEVPGGETFHPGEVWGHDLGVEFAVAKTGRPEEFMRSEVVRYLGWPAQAISYKVGERHWLAAREAARKAQGTGFDLKAFHTRALNLGPMGLEALERVLGGEG